jgi:hypothetical protein
MNTVYSDESYRSRKFVNVPIRYVLAWYIAVFTILTGPVSRKAKITQRLKDLLVGLNNKYVAPNFF